MTFLQFTKNSGHQPQIVFTLGINKSCLGIKKEGVTNVGLKVSTITTNGKTFKTEGEKVHIPVDAPVNFLKLLAR